MKLKVKQKNTKITKHFKRNLAVLNKLEQNETKDYHKKIII